MKLPFVLSTACSRPVTLFGRQCQALVFQGAGSRGRGLGTFTRTRSRIIRGRERPHGLTVAMPETWVSATLTIDPGSRANLILPVTKPL